MSLALVALSAGEAKLLSKIPRIYICIYSAHFLVLLMLWRLDAASNSFFNAKIENQQKVYVSI